MHCREPHSDDFINENTSTTWRLSTYKTYKEQVMFDAEKARLPESQQYAAAVKEARKLIVELKRNQKDLVETLRTKRRTLKNGETDEEEADALRDNRQSIWECELTVRTLGRAAGTAATPAKKASFIKACPADSCRGFLGSDFVCGLCSTAFCSECHESLQAGHTCNADTVASVKALAKESKPCPTCAAVISKIDGCDQMWCTQCQTTFSWRTGLKEEGRIHNPHYYQWMRLNGGLPREPGDNAGAGAVAGCGMPAIHLLIALFSSHDRYIHNIKSKRWENWIRVQHMIRNGFTLQQAVDHYNRYGAAQMDVKDVRQAPTFVWEPTQGWEFVANAMAIHRALGHRGRDAAAAAPAPDNHDLRVKLLLSEISEEAMKVTVQRRAKQWQKDRAVAQVNEMVNQTSADLFRAYFNELTACAATTWEYLIDPDTKQTYWRSLSKIRWIATGLPGVSSPPKENWAQSIHPPIHKKFNTEITALIKYANSCYQRIESTYKNKVEKIVMHY